MTEEMLFQQLDFYRYLTISFLDSVDENVADIIPSGFNNSIRWNLGHIYVSHENIIFGMAGENLTLPEGFADRFEGGTKPADWKSEPPRLSDLRAVLTEQPNRIKKALSGRLADALAHPMVIPNHVAFKSIGEAINFAMYHEGQHTGFIKALKKALQR